MYPLLFNTMLVCVFSEVTGALISERYVLPGGWTKSFEIFLSLTKHSNFFQKTNKEND